MNVAMPFGGVVMVWQSQRVDMNGLAQPGIEEC